MMALARLDLPDWVAPAFSQCGTTRKSITHGCPVSSMPGRTASKLGCLGRAPHDGQRIGSGGQQPDPAGPGRGDPDGVDAPGVRELFGTPARPRRACDPFRPVPAHRFPRARGLRQVDRNIREHEIRVGSWLERARPFAVPVLVLSLV